jgi:hypothetical protein
MGRATFMDRGGAYQWSQFIGSRKQFQDPPLSRIIVELGVAVPDPLGGSGSARSRVVDGEVEAQGLAIRLKDDPKRVGLE